MGAFPEVQHPLLLPALFHCSHVDSQTQTEESGAISRLQEINVMTHERVIREERLPKITSAIKVEIGHGPPKALIFNNVITKPRFKNVQNLLKTYNGH